MEGVQGRQIPYDPYNDFRNSPGREAFAELFIAEEYFVMPQSYLNDKAKEAQRKAVVRMIELNSPLTGDALIPYTAMTYYDRYASRGLPCGRNLELFVICCLTIAWKLRQKSFNLSIFLRERRLTYSTQDVLKMELEICRGLEWRMRTLTPFCFVEFFIPILNLPPDLPSPRRSVRYLIVRSQFDIAFTGYRPSVLAASAMLTVSSKMFPDPRHNDFELKITTDVEPLRLLEDMILKCKEQLEPLYRNPPLRQPNDDVAIQVDPPQPSQPIPIPRRHPPSYSPVKGQPSGAFFSSDSETQFDMSLDSDPGIHPATSQSIQPAAPPEVRAPAPAVEDGIDEMMDFELGWMELLEEAEKRDGPAWISSGIIQQMLIDYWIGITTAYQDVKDTVTGRCNIM